jgi:hypothetical protein
VKPAIEPVIRMRPAIRPAHVVADLVNQFDRADDVGIDDATYLGQVLTEEGMWLIGGTPLAFRACASNNRPESEMKALAWHGQVTSVARTVSGPKIALKCYGPWRAF